MDAYRSSCCISGLTKGVGFIRFNLKCEAEAAIKLRSGTVPPGATEPITVKFANQSTISKVTAAPVQPATSVAANLKYAIYSNSPSLLGHYNTSNTWLHAHLYSSPVTHSAKTYLF